MIWEPSGHKGVNELSRNHLERSRLASEGRVVKMKAFDGTHKTCSMKCPKEMWFGGKAEVQILYARESEMNDQNKSFPSFAVDQLGLQDLWHRKIEGRESCD